MDKYFATFDNLKTGAFADLHIVLGNESCDLDSAVSSLVYATFLYWQYMQIKCKVCTKGNRDENLYKDDLFIPILNVNREDYSLKTEVTFCFKDFDIDQNKFIFRDDLDLKELVGSRKVNVVLVDHHILAKRDQFLSPYVTEIIDHRPLDKSGWKYKEDTRSLIETVGSCSTLVASRIRGLSALIAKEEDFFNKYLECAELLHSTIILDTVNFSKEVNKATPQDEEIVLFLESITKPRNYNEDRKCKLERLVEARRDVSTLTPAQLLRKDVKIIRDVVVPTFPILVEEFLQRNGSMEAMSESLVRYDCTIMLLLGMSLVGGLQRDVAVFSPRFPDKAAELAKYLQEYTKPVLNLTAQGDREVNYMKQGNLSASRKQFIPPLQEFLQK